MKSKERSNKESRSRGRNEKQSPKSRNTVIQKIAGTWFAFSLIKGEVYYCQLRA